MPHRVKRFSVAALMGLLLLNIWTGGPLLALWIGSRVQGEGPPTMGAILVVLLVLGLICFGLYWALQRTSRLYDDLTGTAPGAREPSPWLRSMRGERADYEGVSRELAPGELIMVGGVILAVAAFEVWFFFFSGSPIGSG